MTPERWRKIKEIAFEAMELDPEKRAAFLQAEAGDDDELRQRVEKLIEADAKSGDSFADAIGAAAAGPPGGSAGKDGRIGWRISHYRIIEKIGEGGMGVVYKAEDTKLGRSVALKFLAPHLLRDEDARKRFEREARAAAALDHPNICAVHEIDEADGRTFIALAFLDGQTLRAKIAEGPLEISDARAIAVQLSEGLAAAHDQGVVHRDMKPENVMLVRGARRLAKIMDFGLAQLAGSTRLSGEGSTMGTIAYMSPEQAQGDKVDQRSDIWSLGATLYEMLAGQRPFQGEFDQAIVYSILNEDPRPLSDLRPDVPEDLARIVGKALAKRPQDRYQQAGEILEDLGAPRDQASGVPRPAPARAQAATSRRKYLALAAAAVVLTVVSFAVLRESPPEQEAVSEPLEAVPFTSYSGGEGRPAFSPDGDRVAFDWAGEKQDNWDIYVKLIGPGNPLRLTTDPEMDLGPAWSPDGRYIAFLRGRLRDEVGVFLVPALGGSERRLAQIRVPFWATHVGTCLNWSPDSRWLAVCDGPSSESEGPRSLFLLSTDSGEMRRITSAPADSTQGDVSPAFSPDGRTLAFARFGGGWNSDLHLLDLGDDLIPRGEPRRLTFTESLTTSPVFTADGSDIVFSSGGYKSDTSLWRAPVSGSSPPQRLPSVGGRGSSFPAISRQGNRLAYVATQGSVDIWRMDLPGAEGAAGTAVKLISSSRLDEMPRFSPDGNSIAFKSTRSGSMEIWKCDTDGSNAVQLTSFGTSMTNMPRWSPDGKKIVFSSDAEGPSDIYLVNADGGAPRRLTADSSNHFPAWSRDGKWIYFNSNRPGEKGGGCYRMPAAGGEAVEVIENGGFVTESPDGKLLYFLRGSKPTSLWRVPVEGGKEVQVLESVYFFLYDVFDDGIYFVPESTREAGFSLRFHRFETGAVEPVVNFEEQPLLGLSVAPDRRSVLYIQGGQKTSDIMLVENFR